MADIFVGWADGVPANPDEKVVYRLASAAKNDRDPVAALRLARKAAADGEVARSIDLYQYVLDLTSGAAAHPRSQLARYNAKFHMAVAYYDDMAVSSTSTNVERGIALIRDVVATEAPDIAEEYQSIMTQVEEHEEVLTFGEVLRSAQFNLGSAYMEGVGTIKNDQMALGWFQKGAKNGCQQSMGALGRYYSGGAAIDPISAKATEYVDLAMARKWHTQAAELGNTASMAAIGTMHGLQTSANAESGLALQWLKCGANCGSLAAMASLALLYYRLHFYNKSVQWSLRIAAMEDSDVPPVERKFYALGCWLLGRCHELGRGADKARDEANALFGRAAKIDVGTVKRIHGNPEF